MTAILDAQLNIGVTTVPRAARFKVDGLVRQIFVRFSGQLESLAVCVCVCGDGDVEEKSSRGRRATHA